MAGVPPVFERFFSSDGGSLKSFAPLLEHISRRGVFDGAPPQVRGRGTPCFLWKSLLSLALVWGLGDKISPNSVGTRKSG